MSDRQHSVTTNLDSHAPVDLSQFRFGSSEVERIVCGEQALGALDELQSRDSKCWHASFSPISSIATTDVAARPLHVCIATEEIVGPVRNGGIGTTYAYLSELLGTLGIETTILYLRGQEVENGTIDQWIEHYAAKGVKFVPVPNYAAVDRLQTGADRWLNAPYNMMRYLLDHPMDVVHVSEWRGSGYLSLLAKRQGLAFTNTLFIVKTSSPWLWNRLYGSQPVDRIEDLTKIFAERKSVELADMVIGGSAHLLRWMLSQGYQLPAQRTFVQPNVVFFDHLSELLAQRSTEPGTRVPIEEIVFFGRLEARKGIFLFCEAINRLANYGIKLPAKISFMGKPGARLTARPDQDILEYIDDATKSWDCEVSVLTEFQQQDALQYLLSGARLAVMPSIIENSSLAVYEATMCGIPFVASSSGGTPELVAEEDRPFVLCEAHPIPLADMMQNAIEIGGYVARPSFDNGQNLQEWRDFHVALGKGLHEELVAKSTKSAGSLKAADVSVLVYHCKDEPALERTLASLAAQDAPPSKVLVGLDCPIDEARSARALIARSGLPAECIDCYNFDAGLAYNVMARSAETEFMLFLWSGTQLRTEALRALLRTALASGAEVLNFFHRVLQPSKPDDSGYLNAAILGSVTEAFFRADLSPMPVMAAATAFQSLGGFSTDYRVLGCEQEFVARCQVQGLPCTTALMEMGSVEAWDPVWIKAKCYDEAVSYFRAIRPLIASAPLALRDMMLLSKGLQAKVSLKKPPIRRAPTPARSKEKSNTAFSQLFALLSAPSAGEKKSEPQARSNGLVKDDGRPFEVDTGSSAKKRENAYIAMLRNQLHELPGSPSERFTGRLLGVHNMHLYGWVCDEQSLDRPVMVECFRNGRKIAEVSADFNLDSAIPIPKDLRGHAFRIKVPKPFIVGHLSRRPMEISLRILGTSILMAVTQLGHKNLESAGYDGHCEVVRPGVVTGWAWKPSDPDSNVDVALFVDGHFLVRVPCVRDREDLKEAGIGYGNHGFEVSLPKILRDGRRRIVHAVVADTGTLLKSGRLALQGNALHIF